VRCRSRSIGRGAGEGRYEVGHAGGKSFDCPGADSTHRDDTCSLEVLVETHRLTDPELRYLARIVQGADIPADLTIASEAAGLQAIAQGFATLCADDHRKLVLEFPLYDACARGAKPRREERGCRFGHDVLVRQVVGQLDLKPQRRGKGVAQGRDMIETSYTIDPIGVIRSELTNREAAPRQGYEGAPHAWLEVNATVADGLEGIAAGNEIIVITWFHQAHRDKLKLHPRGDKDKPLTGVFATRSPDRPNPLGLHRVTVLEIAGSRLRVGPIEAIDGTPVVDLKPVLPQAADS
jgi:tRNA-Thr(GGU) m(6)t(6)A37 methyltransferase TsaA